MAIVYKITCIPTGQIYFGWTIYTLMQRFSKHCRSHRSYYISRCVQKYGKENFKIERLFEFSTGQQAAKKEMELIAQYQTNICRYPQGNGMNMTDGGEWGTEGYKHSDATKEKIRKSSIGRKHSEKTRLLIGKNSKIIIRKPHTVERKKAISEILKKRWAEGKHKGTTGLKFSQETKEKMRKAAKGKKKSENHKKNISLAKRRKTMDGLIIIENSSNLTGYFYEAETQCLFIEFKGGALYSYDGVPIEVMSEFEKAQSKGSFVAKELKDKYKCVKFEPEKKVENSENNT